MGVWNNDTAFARPTILVNVGNDDPTRGDAAGWRGLARAIAKKTGAQVLYSDTSKFVTTEEYTVPVQEELKDSAFRLGSLLIGAKAKAEEKVTTENVITQYPEKLQDYETALAQNLERYAPPSIVFGKRCNTALRSTGQDPEDVYYVTDYNESLSSSLLSERELVSHHLTPEILAEAGAKFDEKHPDIKKPIIAVMLVDPYDEDNQNDFTARITKMVKHYPEATIYLCSSRRTEKANYDQLLEKLQKSMIDAGLNTEDRKRVDVVGYAFDRKAAYNPYQGLIARAKHFIIWGDSMSMMSEALYSGKTVYAYKYGYAENLVKKGCVRQFNELNMNEPPFSKQFEPINLTDQLANKLIETITNEQGQRRKRLVSKFARDFGKEECAILEALSTNFRRADQIDQRLKTNRRFVEAAVSVRGFALQFFPAFQDDAVIVKKAIDQNFNSIKFAGEALLDNTRFMTELISTEYSHRILPYASQRLKGDYDFMVMASKYDEDTFKHASPALQQNENFVFELIENGIIKLEDIPAHFLEDPDTLLKIVRQKPEALTSSKIFAKTPELAMQVLQIDAEYYTKFPETIRDNDAVTDMAVAMKTSNYLYAPDSQKDRMSLTMSVLEKEPTLLSRAPEAFRDNDGLLRMLVEKNPACFRHASKRLRSDVDMVAYAMQFDPDCFKYAEGDAAMTMDLALMAVQSNPDNIRNVDINFLYKQDFALRAINEARSAKDAMGIYLSLCVKDDYDVCEALVNRDIGHMDQLPHHVLSDSAFYQRAIGHRDDIQFEDLKFGRHIPHDYAEAIIQVKPEWAYLPALQEILNPQPIRSEPSYKKTSGATFTSLKGLLSSMFGLAVAGGSKDKTQSSTPVSIKTAKKYDNDGDWESSAKSYHSPQIIKHASFIQNVPESLKTSFDHDVHKEPDPVIIRDGEVYVWKTNAQSSLAKPDGKGGVVYELSNPVAYKDALLDQPKGEFGDLVGIYEAIKGEPKGMMLQKNDKTYALLASYHRDLITEYDGKIIVGMQHTDNSFNGALHFYERPVVFAESVTGPADVANPHWVGLYVPVDPDTQKPVQGASFASKADMIGAKKDKADEKIIASVLKKAAPTGSSGQDNAM